MTEEQAKTKLCPMTFDSNEMITCFASECMAWVWEKEYCTSQMDEVESTTRGHCGLVK